MYLIIGYGFEFYQFYLNIFFFFLEDLVIYIVDEQKFLFNLWVDFSLVVDDLFFFDDVVVFFRF